MPGDLTPQPAGAREPASRNRRAPQAGTIAQPGRRRSCARSTGRRAQQAYDVRLARRLWPETIEAPLSRWLIASLGMLVVLAVVNLARPLIMGDVIKQADRGDARSLLRDGVISLCSSS